MKEKKVYDEKIKTETKSQRYDKINQNKVMKIHHILQDKKDQNKTKTTGTSSQNTRQYTTLNIIVKVTSHFTVYYLNSIQR